MLIFWGGVRAGARWFAAILPALIIDLFGLIGLGSLSYGCWLVYRPSGFIAAGVVLIAAVAIGLLRRK
jgi:hypothetical protein